MARSGSLPSGIKGKSHDIIAGHGVEPAMAAGCYDDDLPPCPTRNIGHRSRLPAGRQASSPQFVPGLCVERADIAILGGSNQRDAAAQGKGSAGAWHANRQWQTNTQTERAGIPRGAEWLLPKVETE